MNDQDSNRSPGGNVLRFTLHRQGQNSQVSTRCHGMPCRGSLQLPNSAELGYRPTGSNLQPSTDRRNGFLPALNERVSTLGIRWVKRAASRLNGPSISATPPELRAERQTASLSSGVRSGGGGADHGVGTA